MWKGPSYDIDFANSDLSDIIYGHDKGGGLVRSRKPFVRGRWKNQDRKICDNLITAFLRDKVLFATFRGGDVMQMEVLNGILIPFLGTSLGSECVLFVRNKPNHMLQRALTGFAAGVMVAASVWSLLIPAMEQSVKMGSLSFVPAAAGFWLGILFLLLLDKFIPHLHQGSDEPEGIKSRLKKTTMLVLAVTLHNIPEGMEVGVVFAGYVTGNGGLTFAGAMALSIGIAIQNFPEGAIISMTLKAEGVKKPKAFLYGILSGAVEPAAAFITVLSADFIVPVLPYLLSFAAGAMIYVVVEELIPEMSEGKHSNVGTLLFAAGFTVMMALDVALG